MSDSYKFMYHKDGALPENLNEYIFVFGSNLRGIHGKGAALVARRMFGAELGVGIGYTGRSYAIPTKDRYIKTLPLSDIKKYVSMFCEFTHNKSDLKFWVTAVGCGLAGYSHKDIAHFFTECNTNCIFAESWTQYLK